MAQTASRNQEMEFFRAKQKRTIIAPVFGKSKITMTRISCATPGHGLVDPHEIEDAFLVAFNLRDYCGDLWVDGKKIDYRLSRSGNFTIYDYRRTWCADMKSPFDGLGIHIPRSALKAYEEDLGGQRVDTLHAEPGRDVDDPVVKGLIKACLPALANPYDTSRLFQDHIGALLTFHLCSTHGQIHLPPVAAGALAPWQVKRAMELLEANLTGDVAIETVAAECGLSISYFIKAFRLTTGHPPYRWLILKRLEKAKNLLRTTNLSLADIAALCGFCDQAHMTRSFSARIGATPGQWRKALH